MKKLIATKSVYPNSEITKNIQLLLSILDRHFSGGLCISHGDQVVFGSNETLPFNIHSVTKLLTTVAIAILYETGKIDLTEPISGYLPGWAVLPAISNLLQVYRIKTRYLYNRANGGDFPLLIKRASNN